jgi:HD-GYP domain-containing protein (c-di-GMP phosphodiesterase class II)
LKSIEFPWPIADIIVQHHERMDGSGYPSHLRGEEIGPEARILAVADVVEAMTFHRSYRPALGLDAALREINKNKSTLYDPKVAEACLDTFLDRSFKWENV